MFQKSKDGYQPLPSTSCDKAESWIEENVVEHLKQGLTRTRKLLIISICINILTVSSLIMMSSRSLLSSKVLNQELRSVWSYSPLHDLIDLELAPARVNGSLFPAGSTSIARQMPNPTSDEIWDEWELTRIFPISKEQVVDLGKDPDTAVKLEDSLWSLGEDAYAAQLDVFHQLHCLNTLRQIAYGTYYNMSMVDPSPSKSTMKDIHLNHCVDILMQALQCSGNVNLITMHWAETQDYPFPDMSINRKCTNFEKLVDWRRDNTIDMDRYVEVMKKPSGVKEKPMTNAFYEMHGWKNPHPDPSIPEDSI